MTTTFLNYGNTIDRSQCTLVIETMESNEVLLEKELISAKQDLRMLKSFTKKIATNNKMTIRIVEAILNIALPNKKYDWDNLTEDNVADIITCYEILWQDVLSTGKSLQDKIDKFQSEVVDLQAQIEERKKLVFLEQERSCKFESDLGLATKRLVDANLTIDLLKSQMSKCAYPQQNI